MPRRRQPQLPVNPVSLETFAEHAGVSIRHIRRLAAAGVIPVYRVVSAGRRSGVLRVDLADLHRVIALERPDRVAI